MDVCIKQLPIDHLIITKILEEVASFVTQFVVSFVVWYHLLLLSITNFFSSSADQLLCDEISEY